MDALPHLRTSCRGLGEAEGSSAGRHGPCPHARAGFPSGKLAGPPVQLQANPNRAVSGN